MIRAKIATLMAVFGLLCVISPSGVIGVPIRPIGAVYFLAGGLVAQNVHTGRPTHSKHVVAVCVICALGLSLGVLSSRVRALDPVFAPTLCILFPLTAGVADSAESIALSVVSVFALIFTGMAAYEPSFANAPGDLVIAFAAGTWIAFGLPLYAVGREWRIQVPNADSVSPDPV